MQPVLGCNVVLQLIDAHKTFNHSFKTYQSDDLGLEGIKIFQNLHLIQLNFPPESSQKLGCNHRRVLKMYCLSHGICGLSIQVKPLVMPPLVGRRHLELIELVVRHLVPHPHQGARGAPDGTRLLQVRWQVEQHQ